MFGKNLFILTASLLASTAAFATTVHFDANHMPITTQGKAAGHGVTPVALPANPTCGGCWPSGFTVSNLPEQLAGKFPNTGMNPYYSASYVSGPTSAVGNQTIAQMFNSGAKKTVADMYAGLWNFSGANAAGDAQLSIYNDNGLGTAPGKLPVGGCVLRPGTVAPAYGLNFTPGYVEGICKSGKGNKVLVPGDNYWLVASASGSTTDAWGANVGDQVTTEPFAYAEGTFVGGSAGATVWYTGYTPAIAESYAVH